MNGQHKQHHTVMHDGTEWAIPDNFVHAGTVTRVCGGITATTEIYEHGPTGMQFVLVPGGRGHMGQSWGKATEGWEAKPQHEIVVSPFLLARFPVTQRIWSKVMNAGLDGDKDKELPATNLAWARCDDFCRKLGLQLPSEAEWEYACRSGCNEKFYFGSKESALSHYAWYADNAASVLKPVGLKEPNAFGLYDMLGQVWEWCADTWHDTYVGAPTDGSPWQDSTSVYRVVRGGTVEHGSDSCCCSARTYHPAELAGDTVGFRPKCSLLPDIDRQPKSMGKVVVPNGFNLVGSFTGQRGGVALTVTFVQHTATGIPIPLLPGAVYDADLFPDIWCQVNRLGRGEPRTGVCKALRRYGNASLPVLLSYFIQGEPEIRALAGLAYLSLSLADASNSLYTPDPHPTAMSAYDIFLTTLGDENSAVRSSAARAFAGAGEHAAPAVQSLGRMLHDREIIVRISVLETFLELGVRAAEALPAIVNITLRDPEDVVRRVAQAAWDAINCPALPERMSGAIRATSLPLLEAALQHPGALAAATAAHTLWLLDGRTTPLRPALLRALSDDDENARTKAARVVGLAKFDDEEIRIALGPLERDSSPAVREQAQFARRELGQCEVTMERPSLA